MVDIISFSYVSGLLLAWPQDMCIVCVLLLLLCVYCLCVCEFPLDPYQGVNLEIDLTQKHTHHSTNPSLCPSHISRHKLSKAL